MSAKAPNPGECQFAATVLPDRLSPLTKADGVAMLTRKSISAVYAMADGGDLVDGT